MLIFIIGNYLIVNYSNKYENIKVFILHAIVQINRYKL